MSLPDDPPWTIQKPHIDLFLTHQKKHLGDDCMFQSLFAELKGYYSDHRAIYTDGSKTENRVASAATSDGLSAQVRLPINASIFTAELQAMKMAFIYLFGVLRHFQHCTGHITTGSWKGRGNQYIQFVRVLYCKLLTNGKQLPAFPLEAVLGIEPRPQRWEARVLPLCHRGPENGF